MNSNDRIANTEVDGVSSFLANGGTAFPAQAVLPSGNVLSCSGMSLRDWFAGQALAGICANGHTPWSPNVADIEDAEVARAAYDLADAMLAARAKGGA